MTYGVYVIRDKKAGYLPPMFDLNDACAIRNFQQGTMNASSTMYTHGSDFELYRIGEFETESGIITPEDKTFLFSGKDHYALEESV